MQERFANEIKDQELFISKLKKHSLPNTNDEKIDIFHFNKDIRKLKEQIKLTKNNKEIFRKRNLELKNTKRESFIKKEDI